MVDAAANLLAGNLVAFPTETVYGLGADACNADAVARIYSVKGRPADHPLIVHVATMEGLGDWADYVPGYAISLARDFWPGPMTLIMKRSELAGDFVTGGQDTVGVRVPDHPVALGLLEAFARAGGKGVAAPSANRFGNVSPTTAQAVADELSEYLGSADQILDGGPCQVGVESTIIDCTGDVPRILRPGAVTVAMIEESTGLAVGNSNEQVGGCWICG
jgi:L-threonylcarbamoyladenylate synthase